MKPFKHFFRLSGLLTALMVLNAGVANATTYYSKSGATAANLVASWTTSSTGVGGSAPLNFTTAGDIFIIRAGQSMNTTNTWAVTGSLQISATGSLTTGTTNTWTMSIGGTTSVSGTLTLKNTATKTFTGDVTVPSGGSMVLFAGSKQVTTHNLIVNSGGTLTHNTNYDNGSTILEVLGNLDINGIYTYTGFAPAVIMDAPSGTWNINTQNTSLCMLFLKNAIYKCSGDVTVNDQFYAMWNLDQGEFHTNGFDVTATTWGMSNAGGTVFVDGGTLTLGGTVGGLVSGHTGPTGDNGHVTVSSGTLTTTGLYIGIAPAPFTFTSTFTQTGGTVNAAAVVIDGSTTVSKYLHSGGTLNVSGPIILNSPAQYTCTGSPVINAGSFSSSGTFTAAGSTVTIGSSMTNSGTLIANTSNIAVGGNWSNSGTFTCNTSSVTFNGAGGQDIGGSVASIFNNLTINDAAGVTISNTQTVNNTLTLTSGRLNIGANNLILPTTALAVAGGPFSASNMIQADGTGEVRKSFSANGSYAFPIGDNTGTAEYSPITINMTGTGYSSGYAGVKVTNAKHANNASSTDYLNRYWTVSNSGITSPSYTASATYVAADIAGTEANIAGAKYIGSLPWIKYGVISSNTLTTTAITNTSAVLTGISNFPPTVSISGGGVTICSGSTTASLNAIPVNATNSISYAWAPITGLSSSTIANPIANPATTTSYTVTVTDGNGFTGTANTTITVASPPATPTITAGGPLTFCTGGSVTLTSSAGTTYLWSTGATTSSISPTTSGSYTVQVTSAAGCQSAASAAKVVTVNTLPATPTITAGGPLTFCTGGSVTLTSSAGTTYLWSTGATTASISPTTSGSYTVQVTNAAGCQSAASAAKVVTVNALPATPTISAGGPLTFCAGGSVTLTSSAGTTYLWSTGATTASISPTTSGSYTVQVTNAAGCQSAASAASVVTVNTLPATPTITAGGPLTFCAGGSVTLTSSAGTTYLWSTGATTASISPTTSGSYTVQVTNAAGCQSAASAASVVTVNTLPATPTISAGGPLTFCTGGSVALTSSAGTTYLWSTGATTSSISPTTSGSYTVQVTNVAGCQSGASAAKVVTVNTLPATPTITAGGPLTFCAGGSVTLTSSAGTTYLWSTGATTSSISPTTSGSYTVQVTNAAGCQSASSAATTVTVNALPATPTISAGGPLTFCAGGSVTLTSSAGTTYLWSTGAITSSISPTTSGSYTVQVTNAAGCQSASSAATTVTVNTRPTGALSGTTSICNGNSATLTIAATGSGTISGTLLGGTVFSGTAPTITVNVSPSLTTTYTIATMTNGTCASIATDKTGSATVTVTTPPAATISYATPFCSNSGTAAVTFSGTSGGSYSSSPAGASINSGTGLIDLTLSSPGQYTITYTVAAAGGCSLYTTNTVVVINPYTWTGGISTDWNTAGNWAGNTVPTTACSDVTILSGVPYQPTLGSGIATIQNIFINSGATLTVSNATLQLSGTINNSGTFDVSNGAIEMNGSASQTIPANAFQNNALKDLIISNSSSGGVDIGGALDVYGSLTYTGAGMKLTTNDNLALKSNAANTAWIGDMTGNTITGKVSVERYISAHRAWRFLSVPTNTSQTIKQSWQENQAANNTSLVGWGTQISSNRATWSADGFDFYSTGGPSMKTYNSSTAAWDGVTGTSIGIKSTDGYMLFIRGDRSANGAASTATETVVRTKGDLYTGDQAPIIIPAGKFGVVGNPYASALDMRYITKTGVKNFFYLWDPNIGGTYGLGGYQTFSYNGSDYEVTPGMGSYGASGSVSNYIQSGLAFFVQATGSGGSVTLKEGAKTSGSAQVSIAVRPMQSAVSSPVGLSQSKLRTNLYGVNTDNSTYIVDGILNNYGDDYSNKVDDMDAIKSQNTGENLSIKTDSQLLAIERRQNITKQDTIFLTLGHVKVQKYRFEFSASFNQPGLTGYLEDSYLNTRTLLNMNGTTTADFSIVNIPAAYAANRFRIVFTQSSVLPLTITSVKAYQVNKSIAVEWKTANESNMKQYEVEKSVDGNHYLKANTVAAHNATINNYSWLDAQPVSGYNYYRIKSIDINGEIKYSAVVKVFIGKAAREVTVYPNPVTNNTINLQLVNQPAGNYTVKLLNNMGQPVVEKDIEHAEGSSTELIPVIQSISKGIYQLQVIKPDGSIVTNKLIF